MDSINKIEEFQLFCLENYRMSNNLSGEVALEQFISFKVFEFLESGFEVLHTQGINYIISEINEFIKSRQ